MEGYLGEKFQELKGARKDLRAILAACNAIQAYLKPQEPDAKKAAVAKYKEGTKGWIESDGIEINSELVAFLEKV